MKTSSLVLRSAVIAALGGLLFGFDTAVISGTVDALKDHFKLDDWWLGFTVAIALVGTIFGAATAQWPSNRWGRKPTLLLMAVFYFVSAAGSAFPWDWYSFLFFRFIGGIAVGAASVVSPIYTAEIAPARSRGLLVAITQFNIVFGILLAFFSNYIIAGSGLGSVEWRWMFGVEAFPAAAFFFLLFIVPESPRWLISEGKIDRARPVLAALGTDTGDVEEEIELIRTALREEQSQGKETFFRRRYRFPILLAICIAAFNQLSGINAILYYAPKIFLIAGADRSQAMFFPIIIGLTNLLFTMAAMSVIDRFGRKTLMFVGSVGYVLSLGIVAGAFLVFAPEFNASIKNVNLKEATEKLEKAQQAFDDALPDERQGFRAEDLKIAAEERDVAIRETDEAETALRQARGSAVKVGEIPKIGIMIVLGGLMLFIASHAFGQGACIWVFISEIFPNTIRAQGQSLGSFVHWTLNAVVSMLFLPLLAIMGPANIFLVFCGMMLLQLIWVIFVMPETKQVPLEEMQRKLGIEPMPEQTEK